MDGLGLAEGSSTNLAFLKVYYKNNYAVCNSHMFTLSKGSDQKIKLPLTTKRCTAVGLIFNRVI